MRLPILCYHKVGSEEVEGRWLTIHPDRLRSHIQFFKRRGYQTVQAQSLASETWPERAYCLTFDDAYTSTLENGVPVLLSEGVTATIYAVPGKVGRTSDWDGDRAAPLADWPVLLEAQSRGIEIGNHTMNHPRLPQLSPEDCIEEVRSAQQTLEGHEIRTASIAYPYGDWSAETARLAGEAGLRVGLILEKRIARSTEPRLQLPRIPLSYGDSIASLIYKLWVRPILP